MSYVSRMVGGLRERFRLGKPSDPTSVQWVNEAGKLAARDAGGAAFVNGQGASPVDPDDWVTLDYVNGLGVVTLAQGTIVYPTTGAPALDVDLYPLTAKTLIQYVTFRPETALVGAGNETLRAGITVGGNELLLDQVITSATASGPAAGRSYGYDIAELGLSMFGQLGYSYEGVAGTVIRARLTVSGAVTAGSIKYWVGGLVQS